MSISSRRRPAELTESPAGRPRFALVVHWGGAAFLAPWIVLLYLTQRPTGYAYHFWFVSIGITGLLASGLVVAAWLSRHQRRALVLAASFTGTLAFVRARFDTVSTTGRLFVVALVHAVVVLVPVTVLSFFVVRRVYTRRRAPRRGVPAWAPVAFAAAALAVALFLVAVALSGSSVRAVSSLRLLWTGLDCFELWFMVATGVHLRRGTPMVAVTAMCLGTLMFADAWFNIVATTGNAQLAAVGMALGEIPLAVYSFHIARLEVRRWATVPGWPLTAAGTAPDPAGTGR